MNSQVELNLRQGLEKPNLNVLSTKAMAIWRKTEEGTELYSMAKDLIDAIEVEQRKLDSIKAALSLVTEKL